MNNAFYHLSETLLGTITEDFNDVFKNINGNPSVLIPSAGDGVIADHLKQKAKTTYRKAEIDCIEEDPCLATSLETKGYPVVHNDFLSFRTYKRYDIIFLNPPEGYAAAYLLRAITQQMHYGGAILCVIPPDLFSTSPGLEAKQLLDNYRPVIRYYSDGNTSSDAQIAVVAVQIPTPERFFHSYIFGKLAEKERKKGESSEIVPDGLEFLQSYIRDFNKEAAAGIALLTEYRAYEQIRHEKFGHLESKYDRPILSLKVKDQPIDRDSVNGYLSHVRYKYWNALFLNPNFTGKLTSKMQEALMSRVQELSLYDFNAHNILRLLAEIRDSTLSGIEDSIEKLFDEFSAKYSWIDNGSANIHYYNGWRTNTAHKVNKKVILPMYGAWSSWHWNGKTEWSLKPYSVVPKLTDMAKVLDFLADGTYRNIDTAEDIDRAIRSNFDNGISSNIETKYFILTFYKKGTMHVIFKDDKLLEKFNLYIGKRKQWLPPCYGKKTYNDLSDEERAVADSFSGGKAGYDKIYEHRNEYLIERNELLMLSE